MEGSHCHRHRGCCDSGGGCRAAGLSAAAGSLRRSNPDSVADVDVVVEAEEDHEIHEGGLGTPADVVEENQAAEEDTPMDTLIDHQSNSIHCDRNKKSTDYSIKLNRNQIKEGKLDQLPGGGS